MDQGIESMSLNPDTVVETWLRLARRERCPPQSLDRLPDASTPGASRTAGRPPTRAIRE